MMHYNIVNPHCLINITQAKYCDFVQGMVNEIVKSIAAKNLYGNEEKLEPFTFNTNKFQ